MDVFTLLKQDHAQASEMLQQLEATDAAAERQRIFNELKQALDVHAHIEETIFYPLLKQEAETREITVEAYEEHQEVKDLLQQLSGTQPEGTAWENLVSDLKRAIHHHVKEEETEMFPKASGVLSQQQLTELGTRMQQEKQQQQQQLKAASAG
ncbi:MAG TPA: hemerythrin domain-containing protein [Pyrinomonadaceae bacterium]|jgi:iron-sulfur cluster repair protein YtfE (RIC family)